MIGNHGARSIPSRLVVDCSGSSFPSPRPSGSDDDYSLRLGERIRVIRRQKRLSLQDVEARSEAEFKASVLGAYERGERAVSVPRLHRLAEFYDVPVDQLLPVGKGDDLVDAGTAESPIWAPGQKVVIDLLNDNQNIVQFELL